MKNDMTRVGLRLSPEMKRKLEIEAQRHYTTVSSIVRLAIARYLDRNQPRISPRSARDD